MPARIELGEFDWGKLEGMLMCDATKGVCSSELGISEDVIDFRIKEKYNMTFKEFKRSQTDKTALRLKQKMINKALGGDNTCLIFSLKNLSEWRDRNDISLDENTAKLVLNYKLDEQHTVIN